jgi:integrase
MLNGWQHKCARCASSAEHSIWTAVRKPSRNSSSAGGGTTPWSSSSQIAAKATRTSGRSIFGCVWGGYKLREVTPAVVDRVKSELVQAGVGPPTIRKAFALLSAVFRCAVTWDRVDRNPVREVKLPRSKRSRHVRPLLPESVEAMRARLLGDDRLIDATLVSVLAYAGLRPEEARALMWSDVSGRTILIERAAAGSANQDDEDRRH